ncbi:MAG: hypothetical protein QM831_21775 [Kofleriaceae bacterium]
MRTLLLVFLIACGGSKGDTPNPDGGGSGSATGPVDIDDLPGLFTHAYCEGQARCCTAAEVGNQTEAQCEMQFGAIETAIFGDYKAEIAKGRLGYDAVMAGLCIDELLAASCSAFGEYRDTDGSAALDACTHIFSGQVADAGACQQSSECTNSEGCVGADVDDNGQPIDGMCQAVNQVGAMCDDFCANDLYCNTDEGDCLAKKANGMACTDSDSCESGYCNTTCMPLTPSCVGS